VHPETPLTQEACLRLGIDPSELVAKTKLELVGDDKSKASDLRYENYMQRYELTIKSVHDERKEHFRM
jgi:hypothetical protein